MKNRFFGNFAGAALFMALAFPALAPAAPNKAAAKPAATTAKPTAAAVAAPAPARHPEIEAAVGSLERAKAHLAEARHDFGGHRAEAIHAIDEALRQLHVCEQFD